MDPKSQKRPAEEEWTEVINAKKIEVRMSESFTSSIEAEDDSLCDSPEQKQREEVKEILIPRQTTSKSSLVKYDVTKCLEYNGCFGKSTVCKVARASASRLDPNVDAGSSTPPRCPVKLTETKHMVENQSNGVLLETEYEIIHSCLSDVSGERWNRYKQQNYHHMREQEKRSCLHPKADCTLPLKYREKVYDWLVDIANEFHLSTETLALAFVIGDLYLEKETSIPKSQLQCLGATVLSMASKITFDRCPSLSILSDLSFHTFSPEDINVMEMTILKAFDFNVLFTTSFSFILSYFVQLQLDQPTFIFSALYVLESCLVEGSLVQSCSPSQLAAMSILAILKRDGKKMEEMKQQLMGLSDLQTIPDWEGMIENMLSIPTKLISSDLKAVWRKYSRTSRCEVALSWDS